MIYEAPKIEIITINAHEDVVCDMSSRQTGAGKNADFTALFNEFSSSQLS